MKIGVDQDHGSVFEGALNGREVHPLPHVTKAAVDNPDSPVRALSGSNRLDELPLLLFREDAFDTTTRLRRGRFYLANDRQPVSWSVIDRLGGFLGSRDLNTFFMWRVSTLRNFARSPVVLGSRELPTVWSIVWVEDISTGEQLVTLKARASLGLLPELNEVRLPSAAVDTIKAVADRVVDSAHRGSPQAVVDRCRDAAQHIVGHWFAEVSKRPDDRFHDLGKLASMCERHPEAGTRIALINSARTIARLHARAKPNEQERYNVRELTESDAECAISLLGLIIRELDWAVP